MKRGSRRIHRWIGLLVVFPSAIVFSTGLLLQFKKQNSWIQPPTQKGTQKQPTVQWNEILEVAKAQPDAEIASWADIDRLDVRPNKGVIKIRSNSSWELQIDGSTGAVLSSAYRRSDLIESIHDGSFFSESIKLYVFSANGFGLVILLVTGMYLWYLPVRSKRIKKARLQKEK